jgi:cation transport ATPase
MQSNLPDSALLDVRGMWCTSCANALESMLRRQPGVLAASVSFAAESASLQWDPLATSLDHLLQRAAKLGYACLPEGAGHDRRAHFARIRHDLMVRLVVAVFFSMWVMPAQWALYVAPEGSLSPAARLAWRCLQGSPPCRWLATVRCRFSARRGARCALGRRAWTSSSRPGPPGPACFRYGS